MNEELIEKFIKTIENSQNIVFFGGAGVSTESGIPDFRSKDGLYNQKYDFPPETILSHTFFIRHPEEFYRFYYDKLLSFKAKPNITHFMLAKLESIGKLKAVVTQNIDGLHQDAGSKKVFELHGSTKRNYCMRCHKLFSESYLADKKGEVPYCDKCNGMIKPDVVLYEEGLDDETVNDAVKAIVESDVLVVGGTSLSVYPAAGLIRYYSGSKLILINKSETEYDRNANIVLNSGLGEVFSKLQKKMEL